MTKISGRLAGFILRTIKPQVYFEQKAFDSIVTSSELTNLFGKDFQYVIRGKTVMDFGCGRGRDAVQMALMGAGRVVGLDIQERFLSQGKQLAEELRLNDRCSFVSETNETADIVISKNAFEHFLDPASILIKMSALVRPEGFVWIVFGNTWFHPYGGHLFSVFPWAHLIFSEASLIRWRSTFLSDGATRFEEVEGGLNRITIKRFERIVNDSPFRFESLETIPIRGVNILKHPILREIGTSLIRCKLTLG